MPDIGPNRDLVKKRLLLKQSELKLSIERMELRKCEIDDERRKIDENIAATHTAITEIADELRKI